jgi:DNA polymerase III alpha subunit
VSRKVGSPKGAKAKADRLFSQLIRSRGRCESCGSTSYLQTAHVVSRRFSATRCDENNALCLCAKCHHHYTDHPVEWGRFVVEHMGETAYEWLRDKALHGAKVDWQEVAARLQQRLKDAA